MQTLKLPCLSKLSEPCPSRMLQGSAPLPEKRAKLEVSFIECPIMPVGVRIAGRDALPGTSATPDARMTALVICPAERPAVAALAEREPLVTLPLLGKTLIEYWLEHLANLGARQVLVLATDRVYQVRLRIGDGGRWGLKLAVIAETRELTPAEARSKYRTGATAGDDVRSPAVSNDNALETPSVVPCNRS